MTGLQQTRRNSIWGLLSSVFAEMGPWGGGKRERKQGRSQGDNWGESGEGRVEAPSSFCPSPLTQKGPTWAKGKEGDVQPRDRGSLLGKAASFLRLNRQRGPEGGLSLKHQARLSSVCSEGFGQRL